MLILHLRKSAQEQARKECPLPGERGQSLVEMTIGLLVLLVILFGLLDLGRLWFVFVALEDGAGEGALYLSINPDCPQDDSDPSNGVCDDPNNALWRAQHAGGGLVDWSSVLVTISPAPPYEEGDTVEVSIAYPFQLLTPTVPDIAGGTAIILTAHAGEVVASK